MEKNSSGQYVTRRAFLAALGAGSGVVLVAACGAPGLPAAPTAVGVAPTATPPGPTPGNGAAATPTAATAQPTTTTTASGTAASTTQPKTGGTLTAAKLGDVANLDGHYWSPSGGLHVWLSYDTLARYDQKLVPQPQLAESWDLSSDLTQATLHLRQGVMYHSGREFTSDDVVWNLQRALDPKVTVGILGGFFGQDPTFTATDKYTVQLHASKPWTNIFDMFHVVNMLDKENTVVDSNTQTKAVGTGPFVFQEWQQGELMRFTRNPNYWQTGTPYLDEIVVNVAGDAQSMVVDLESGALNLVFQPTLQDYLRLKADSKYVAQLLTPAAGMYQIQPNVTFQPLDNKLVRQALNYAIDRKRICDTVLSGLVEPEDLPWPPTSPAYQATKNSMYDFDLNKAKSLLDQAGVSNLQLDFAYAPVLPEYATIAQIYQSDLASIGCNLNVVNMDIAALFASIHNQKYHGVYTLNDSWAAMQPISMLQAGASLNPKINNAGFHDDQYTQMVQTAATEPDATKRAQDLSQINDYILDQSFGIPVAPSTSREVSSASVHGIEFRFNDVMYFGRAWIG